MQKCGNKYKAYLCLMADSEPYATIMGEICTVDQMLNEQQIAFSCLYMVCSCDNCNYSKMRQNGETLHPNDKDRPKK